MFHLPPQHKKINNDIEQVSKETGWLWKQDSKEELDKWVDGRSLEEIEKLLKD